MTCPDPPLNIMYYYRTDSSKDLDRALYSDNRSKMEKYKRLLMFLAILSGPVMMWSLPNLYMRMIDMAGDSVLDNPVVFNIYLPFVIILTLMEILVVYGIIRILMIISSLRKNIRE